MSRTTRKAGFGYPFLYEQFGKKIPDKDAPKPTRNTGKKHIKKSTKKIMKLRAYDKWNIPNRDKMGRRV
jgi:hypothetical protein